MIDPDVNLIRARYVAASTFAVGVHSVLTAYRASFHRKCGEANRDGTHSW